jgi:hypothetical protein
MYKALAVIQTLKETGIADNAPIPRVQEVEAGGSIAKVSLSYLRSRFEKTENCLHWEAPVQGSAYQGC